jgi:tRNA-dihydrouridine synthase B
MQIGPYRIEPALMLAPMAGITDKPMRMLCRRFGAAYAVSEMLASDPELAASLKSARRRDHVGEPGPIGVQIAGSDPTLLAEAARFNVDRGAEIIDINMGCPAKKVLKRWAGSALLEDEPRVARILDAVVAAVDVPVTLKIRTGPTDGRRNGVRIARIAEAAGVAALCVHGRTREQRFTGSAEFATIAAIKRAVAIPVIANGDIADAPKAAAVLAETGADGLMLGRAAQGRPWIFREIAAGLAGEPIPAAPEGEALLDIVRAHLAGLYALYGATLGVRVARKHIGWYFDGRSGFAEFRPMINRAETPSVQQRLVADCIAGLPLAGCGFDEAA